MYKYAFMAVGFTNPIVYVIDAKILLILSYRKIIKSHKFFFRCQEHSDEVKKKLSIENK